jgi:DNA-binding response OmpR family regulator
VISRTSPRRPGVLIIEDDTGVSRMLRLSLTSAGFDIMAVFTGKDALRSMESESPDAVVLDLGLPDNLGAVVLKRLKQGGGADGSPAWVVISALDRQEVISQYGPVGANFMAKPFNPWDLVALIESLMSERQSA